MKAENFILFFLQSQKKIFIRWKVGTIFGTKCLFLKVSQILYIRKIKKLLRFRKCRKGYKRIDLKKEKILPFLEEVINSGIKVSNVFIKSKAFHCLLACANRPSKLKCSFWFVLVYSCFLWGGFHWNFANFSSYKTFSACRSWRFCNSKQWSGFRKSNRYSTKWHKLRNSRVEYFCCGSIVSDLKEKEEN